ncbi:hypothetical protein ACNTMW_03950 [Planosporangium sp. 12N6]|uniref:hypothetical protein n=1 Tax=Planosporangium spinosum TaxID=3402278 RepID=UPI003CF8E93B
MADAGAPATSATALTAPARVRPSFHLREPSMSRYLAPLGFTLATLWAAVIFVLVSSR